MPCTCRPCAEHCWTPQSRPHSGAWPLDTRRAAPLPADLVRDSASSGPTPRVFCRPSWQMATKPPGVIISIIYRQAISPPISSGRATIDISLQRSAWYVRLAEPDGSRIGAIRTANAGNCVALGMHLCFRRPPAHAQLHLNRRLIV